MMFWQCAGNLDGRKLVAHSERVLVDIAKAKPVEIEASAGPDLDHVKRLTSFALIDQAEGRKQIGAARHFIGLHPHRGQQLFEFASVSGAERFEKGIRICWVAWMLV